MVNVLGLDFGSPVALSMIVLEICLLCELTSTFTDEMMKLSQNIHPPHQRHGSAIFKPVMEWGIIVYVYIKKPYEWKIFFKLFLSLCIIVLYITYNYLYMYNYINIYTHIYIYVCVYTHTDTYILIP